MWIKLLSGVALLALSGVATADHLKVEYKWNQIDFQFPSDEDRHMAIENLTFIPENVIPVGLEVTKTRIFLTLPRWKKGVPASLAYIDNIEDKRSESPKLKPFPNWLAHKMPTDDDPSKPEIVSPFRIRADACGRLWVLDTGVDDIWGTGEVISKTKLLVYDLHNDNLLKQFEFPDDQVKSDSFFASLAVEDDDCENTFVYCADLGKPGLVVYSWKSHSSWRISHNYFHPDPTSGNFSINGIKFSWNDGLFGLALGNFGGSRSQGPNTETVLYFHPFVSNDEFMVPTKFLKDPTISSQANSNYHQFKRLGTRGENAQSNAEFLDKKSGVLFYTLPNLNAIACWHTKSKEYNVKSQGRIMMNETLMEFPNDVKVDEKHRLWVLSDRLQKFLYDSLDKNEVNFRILMAPVGTAIAHTTCDVKTKPLPDIITNLNEIIKPSSAKDGAGKLEATLLTIIAVLVQFI